MTMHGFLTPITYNKHMQVNMVDPTRYEDLKVLVVDDELILLKVVESTLKKQPYGVITTDSVQQALEILKSEEIAAVISDYKMPKIKGVEFLEKVRKEYPSVIRIMMTAYAELDVSIEAINRVGVFRFVQKPWEQIEFLNTIESALEFYMVRKEKEEVECTLQEHLGQLNGDPVEPSGELADVIDELKRRNQKLARMNEQLSQSDKMNSLGLMAGMLAHDISAPLTMVLEKLDVLFSRENLTAQDRELLLEVKPQIQRIDSLAKSIQNYSRKSPDQYEKIDVVESIQSAIGLAQEVVDFKNIEVVECYPEEMAYVHGVKSQIDQVFIILIQNALQGINNSGTLTCEVNRPETDARDNTSWRINIFQTGQNPQAGIPWLDTDSYESNGEIPRGFGLNICQRVIEEHQGHLQVLQEQADETLFAITFPRMNGHAETSSTRKARKRSHD